MSSSNIPEQIRDSVRIGEESAIEDVETEMSNVDDDVVLQEDDEEIVNESEASIAPTESAHEPIPRIEANQGEMERRAEERLLDERIREKYQKEIGDIFAKSST